MEDQKKIKEKSVGTIMKRIILILIVLIVMNDGKTQSFTDTALWHGKQRELRYHPEGTDFVITNGKRRFVRALYGTNTAFRIEAGDLPERRQARLLRTASRQREQRAQARSEQDFSNHRVRSYSARKLEWQALTSPRAICHTVSRALVFTGTLI